MSQWWWHLSRASGTVATALIVASLVRGFAFTARATGRRRHPAWWLHLHRWLGGLALATMLVHVGAVYRDELAGIGLTQILVPLTASGWAWGIGWGVLATYIFAAVVLTTWPRRRGSRRTWRAIHLLSIPGAAVVGAHAIMVGSSAGDFWFQAFLAVGAGLVVHPMVLRLLTQLSSRPGGRPRTGSDGSSAPASSRPPAAEVSEDESRSRHPMPV